MKKARNLIMPIKRQRWESLSEVEDHATFGKTNRANLRLTVKPLTYQYSCVLVPGLSGYHQLCVFDRDEGGRYAFTSDTS